MRTVLFCLVLSANALPEAHLRGRNRDRDLSVPEDAKNRLLGLASNEKPSVALAHGGAGEPAAFDEGTFQRRLQDPPCFLGQVRDCKGDCCPLSLLGDGTCDAGSGGDCDFTCKGPEREDCCEPFGTFFEPDVDPDKRSELIATVYGPAPNGVIYNLAFTMELASDWSPGTGQWQSVLQIGNGKWQRYPAIWFHPTENRLLVSQTSGEPTPRRFSLYSAKALEFEAGNTYEIRVSTCSDTSCGNFPDGEMTLYVDNENRGSKSVGAPPPLSGGKEFYVGNPYYPRAKVTLSNICLNDREIDPPLVEPTSAPTATPTRAPIPQPTFTFAPSPLPTLEPTGPSPVPTLVPTAPTPVPTLAPTLSPTPFCSFGTCVPEGWDADMGAWLDEEDAMRLNSECPQDQAYCCPVEEEETSFRRALKFGTYTPTAEGCCSPSPCEF